MPANLGLNVNERKAGPPGHSLDCNINLKIIIGWNPQPIMEFTENYRYNWKNHVLQMPCSRISFHKFSITKQKDSFKQLYETLSDH